MGIGHWALGIGYWALGIGHWALVTSSPCPMPKNSIPLWVEFLFLTLYL
ncbi:hypothetical protein [aff. Roholtiella sp. LEGE 12411]